MQAREKVEKSRHTVFSNDLWLRRVEGSLKRRVWSHLGRWEMKNCMPFWREAHFQVKIYKAHQRRSTFGSWDVQKVHAVVARSTFPSQNAKSMATAEHFWKVRCRKSASRCGAKHISKSGVLNTPGSERFWKLRCWKSARRCGAKHISKSGVLKTRQVRSTFGSWDVEKVHAVVALSTFRGPVCDNWWVRSTFGSWDVETCTVLWCEAHLEVNMLKAPHVRTTFGRSTAPHHTLQQHITTTTATITTTANATSTL